MDGTGATIPEGSATPVLVTAAPPILSDSALSSLMAFGLALFLRDRLSTPAMIVLVGSGAVWGFRWWQSTQARKRFDDAAARVRAVEAPAAHGVTIDPVVAGGSRLTLRHVLKDSSGKPVAVARFARRTRMDPRGPFSAVGTLAPGATPALVSEDGLRVLVPSCPLAPFKSNLSVHPATTIVQDLLGWGEAASIPEVGGTERVSVERLKRQDGWRVPDEAWNKAGERIERAQFFLLIASAAWVIAYLAGWVAGFVAFLCVLAAIRGAYYLARRWMRRPVADALVAAGKVDPGQAGQITDLLFQFP